jgi:primosomal protein N'
MADDFGLNIVCEAPIAANRNGVIKKNKKNKYEKRRERSRRAKSQGDSESIPSRPARSSNFAGPVPVDTNTDKPLQREHPNPPSYHQQEVNESEEQGSSDEETRKSENEALSIMPENKVSSSTTPLATPTDVTPVTQVQSRKHRDLLENDEERANYMAEFHARPMEMDRRAGATGTYTASKESLHLFDTKKQLPLHPKLLLQCQTKFNMKQATQIQSNTWKQFHANDEKNNLFVQSETGSGKTLAYLLPIVQVRWRISFVSCLFTSGKETIWLRHDSIP